MWLQKIDEAIVALRLEHRLTKPEILALYLNLAPYGNQITGAERASHAYFGMPASLLTPAQAAFLAALPQRPSRFNPWRNLRAGDCSPASRARRAWSAAAHRASGCGRGARGASAPRGRDVAASWRRTSSAWCSPICPIRSPRVS